MLFFRHWLGFFNSIGWFLAFNKYTDQPKHRHYTIFVEVMTCWLLKLLQLGLSKPHFLFFSELKRLLDSSGGSGDVRAEGCLIPVFGDALVLPLPSGLEVRTKLKPDHEEIIRGHLLLSRLGLQSKVQSQILKAKHKHKKRRLKTQTKKNKQAGGFNLLRRHVSSSSSTSSLFAVVVVWLT